MKKSVYILCTYDSQGGAEQILRNIAEYHIQAGNKVDVFFLKKRLLGYWDYLLDYPNVNLHFTNSVKEKFGIFSFIWNIIKQAKDTPPTIVYSSHGHINSVFDIMRQLGLVNSKFHVARESTHIFRRFTGLRNLLNVLIYKIGYKKIDLLICQTHEMKNDLLEDMPSLSRLIIEVIPNPLNLTGILQYAEEELDEKTEALFNKNICIVAAGRLTPIKGLDILIRSLTKLSDTKYLLVILGEGSQKAELEILADKLGISDKVYFMGYKANPMPYFRKAHLCVVPSIKEGFPNVLLQMMALNSRVVSTLCAGGIESIPGIYKCIPNDVDALNNALQSALESDPSTNKLLIDLWLESRTMNQFIDKVETNLR